MKLNPGNERFVRHNNGESWEDVYERVNQFMQTEFVDNLLNDEENTDQNFLIVTHGGTIMEFKNVLNILEDPDSEDVFLINSKNTCLNTFKLTKD